MAILDQESRIVEELYIPEDTSKILSHGLVWLTWLSMCLS